MTSQVRSGLPAQLRLMWLRGPGMPRWGGADNRSLEYDSLGDRYARFPLEELLPEVERDHSSLATRR